MSTQSTSTLAELLATPLMPQGLISATLITEMGEAVTKAGEAMGHLSQAMDCPCYSAPRQSRRQLPSAEFWSPQLVEDLRGGARAIRRLGWIRGSWVNSAGVCALGGVMVSVSGQDRPAQEWFDPAVGRRDWINRMRAATCAMREWIGGSLPAFNDQSTCAEDVIGELEACAAAVEQALCRASERHERIRGVLARAFTYTPPPRSSEVALTVPAEWLLAVDAAPERVLEPV